MPRKELKAEVKEWIGSVKESNNSDWAKYVLKVSYNDKPAHTDIRNVRFNPDGTQSFGKGISLSDEETDTMVDLLLEKGYGTLNKLEEAVRNRRSIFEDVENDTVLIGSEDD